MICDSIFHWARDCLHRSETHDELPKVQLCSEEIHDCYIEQFVEESLNSLILDSGCTKTVRGKNWLNCFKESLNNEDLISVKEFDSKLKFKFGDGKVVDSQFTAIIPAYIANKRIEIKADIVDWELPLLLSKDAMKKAETTIDFVNDTVNILGETIDLEFTSSGHYMIPISKPLISLSVFQTETSHDHTELEIMYFGVQICLHSHIQKRRRLLSSFIGRVWSPLTREAFKTYGRCQRLWSAIT